MNPEAIYSVGQTLQEKLKRIVNMRRALAVLQLQSSEDTEVYIVVQVRDKRGHVWKAAEMTIVEAKGERLVPSDRICNDAILLGLKKRIDRGIDDLETEAERLRQKMQEAWK